MAFESADWIPQVVTTTYNPPVAALAGFEPATLRLTGGRAAATPQGIGREGGTRTHDLFVPNEAKTPTFLLPAGVTDGIRTR